MLKLDHTDREKDESQPIKVVVVQMCSGPDVDENLRQVEQLLAAVDQADVIVLPECFARFGGDLSAFAAQSKQVRLWMGQLAKQKQSWLVGGSMPYQRKVTENPRASCFVYSPEGHEINRYDKIHLFDVDVADRTAHYRESDDYSAGRTVTTVDMGFARTGLSICYDLRFPELFQQLRARGAELITVPSAFTKVTGKAHWEVLLRARAIENQCYVLAANQCGIHSDSRETWGHSMIISPWGEVLGAAKGSEPCIVEASLKLSLMSEIRQQMPCFEHKVL